MSSLRYVPLIALVIFAVIAAATGFVVARVQFAAIDAQSRPAGVALGAGSAPSLPEICHPDVPSPSSEPWLGDEDSRATAESVWMEHADEVSTPYFAQKDGWYDWGDVQASNISQAVGRRALSIGEAARWNDTFANLESELGALDIPFFVVVTPAKWDVYPEKLPDWAQSIRGSRPLDQLLAGYPELPLVDLRSQMREASKSEPTYSKLNSHWTDYGAWVGWRAVAECLSATVPEFAGITAPTIDSVQVLPDRNEFAAFGIPDAKPNWTVPAYSAPLSTVRVTSGGSVETVPGSTEADLLRLPLATTTTTPQSQATALIARDSYGSALSVPFQQSFASTWQVRHNFDSDPASQPDLVALAELHHPSVVILQIAERHLTFPPPAQ